MITSMLLTEASIEADLVPSLKAPILDNSTLLFEWMLYIYYPMWFKKNQVETQILINSKSEVNAITPVYGANLGFKV